MKFINNLEEFKSNFASKLSSRDYYGMYVLLDEKCNEYLKSGNIEYKASLQLLKACQELYEYLGSSKQFEMAFDLQNNILNHRNKLFISCLNENQKGLIPILKKLVGDFS